MARTLIGIVSSTSPDKTIVIAVNTKKTHPIYKKQYKVTTKFMAHDEENSCKVGDLVSIVETRPISARKRFKLDKILEHASLTKDDLKAMTADAPEQKEKPEKPKAEVLPKTEAEEPKAPKPKEEKTKEQSE